MLLGEAVLAKGMLECHPLCFCKRRRQQAAATARAAQARATAHAAELAQAAGQRAEQREGGGLQTLQHTLTHRAGGRCSRPPTHSRACRAHLRPSARRADVCLPCSSGAACSPCGVACFSLVPLCEIAANGTPSDRVGAHGLTSARRAGVVPLCWAYPFTPQGLLASASPGALNNPLRTGSVSDRGCDAPASVCQAAQCRIRAYGRRLFTCRRGSVGVSPHSACWRVCSLQAPQIMTISRLL